MPPSHASKTTGRRRAYTATSWTSNPKIERERMRAGYMYACDTGSRRRRDTLTASFASPGRRGPSRCGAVAGCCSISAFCGFYVGGGAGQAMFNHATEVVLMRHGTTTVLSMQNNYDGPPEDFAMVVPVPVVLHADQVHTLPRDVFAKIDTLGAPRLVEYWEQDPCARPALPEGVGEEMIVVTGAAIERKDDSVDRDDYHVTIEAQFSVPASMTSSCCSASESTGLEHWLHDNKYEIPAGAAPLLRPYIEQGTKFFVAKVDPDKLSFDHGMATLSPLRFSYDSPELALPIRLGLAASPGTQDLIIDVLAPGTTRYEAANHPNITIPTNLVVTDAVRDRFGEFYAALFDHALAQVPGAVITEYAWSATSCDPCPGPTLDPDDLQTAGRRRARPHVHRRRQQQRLHDDAAAHPLRQGHPRRPRVPRGVGHRGRTRRPGARRRARHQRAAHRRLQRLPGALRHPASVDGPGDLHDRDDPRRVGRGAAAGGEQASGLRPQEEGKQSVVPATNLAFQPRGAIDLSSMLASTVPQLLSGTPAQLPTPVRKPQGCGGCSTGGAGSSGLGQVTMFVIAAAALARRRRRQ